MENLKDLYKKRQAFIEYNSPVPAKLDEQIREVEKAILNSAVQTIVGYLPEEIDSLEDSSIVVAVEYFDGKLVKTASAIDANLEELFDNVNEVEEDDGNEEDDNDTSDRRRTKSVGFTVKFADGKMIRHNTAIRTMIEALRYMGLERSSNFINETFKGYPLIGKKQRPGGRWQKNVDGWWVYVNMANDRKVSCLKGVSKMLNIPLEIISDEDNTSLPIATKYKVETKPKGRRELFSLNGSAPMAKNRSVWETVRRYLEEVPDATFADIAYQFPARLQGSYGVVRTIADINDRKKRNMTEGDRWFLETDEILTAGDGIRFAVSKEWGNNFFNFQEYILKELGWTLEEA